MIEYRAWIERRVRAILDNGWGRDLAGRWPADVPTLKASQEHDETQLEAVDDAVARVERLHRAPFADPDPRVGDEACADLDALIRSLDFDARCRFDWWLDELADCGYRTPLRPRFNIEKLRLELVAALSRMPLADAAGFMARAVGGFDLSREGALIGRLGPAALRSMRQAAVNTAALQQAN